MSLASVDSQSRKVLLSSLGAAAFILSLALLDMAMSGALDLRALIPPFGASTVIVFFSPESAAGRPWNITAGHLGSAMFALATMMLLPDLPVGVQAALAVAGAGVWMVLSKSIHPPGGATALLTTLAGHEVGVVGCVVPLLAGCVTLVGVRWLLDFGVRRWDAFSSAVQASTSLNDEAATRDSVAPAE